MSPGRGDIPALSSTVAARNRFEQLYGCHGDEGILQEFTSYFELVGQPNSANADLGYGQEVEKLLSDGTAFSSTEPMFVDLYDLQACISKLKLGKAVSFDGI